MAELENLCCHRNQVRVPVRTCTGTTDIKDVPVNSFWRLCFVRVPVYDIPAPTYVQHNIALLLVLHHCNNDA
jgi:hypothetical protein